MCRALEGQGSLLRRMAERLQAPGAELIATQTDEKADAAERQAEALRRWLEDDAPDQPGRDVRPRKTDRRQGEAGIAQLRSQRGHERVTLSDVADHVVDYVDRHPDSSAVVEDLALFLAHDASPDRGLARG